MSLRDTYGLACPRCGNNERLVIEIVTMADLTADGTEPFGDHAWGDGSCCRCPCCTHHATLAGFRIGDGALPDAQDNDCHRKDDRMIRALPAIIPTNDDRAKRAAHAVRAYRDYTGDAELSPDEDVIDLLTDLRHFCDRRDLDLGRCDQIAHASYLAELDEEKAGSR